MTTPSERCPTLKGISKTEPTGDPETGWDGVRPRGTSPGTLSRDRRGTGVSASSPSSSVQVRVGS